MKIGDLASATQTPVATIRHYEREGLLPPASRAGNNYRQYGSAHLQRLAFIRRCRALDMALAEVRALLQVQDDPQAPCSAANAVLDAHIGHVAERLRELRALQGQLRALRRACRAPQTAADCGILHRLAELPAGAAAPPRRRQKNHLRAAG